ncbi:MAG: YbaK/prolyl-tRNA synthetase associated domain-containing protein [Chloroflexi bacterium]|nr:YbaK/prolyl-tRNA synthetase associated domain-containing protein [Chloroflexota bacterium]MBI3169753.1 YbaK/prolyl-tRNA synthetase associated domain-containing protein [Chloroflexota bacterium]
MTTPIHEKLKALLDEHNAVYRIIEHEAEGRTEFITKIRGNRIEQAIKSMVVQVRMSKKENVYALANVPGDCRVDFAGIKSYFGADSVAMAAREKAEALTGCTIGSIPPFSFNQELILLADPMIRENEEVVFNAGSLERSIFMKMEDYFRIANPQIAQIATRG